MALCRSGPIPVTEPRSLTTLGVKAVYLNHYVLTQTNSRKGGMSVKRRTGIIIALASAVAVLALAGCSGSDDASTTTASEAASTAPAEPAAVVPEAPSFSAVEVAEQHGVEITSPTGHDEDQAPEFTGLTKWLNSSPLTMEELQGEVVLVDFWTYT